MSLIATRETQYELDPDGKLCAEPACGQVKLKKRTVCPPHYNARELARWRRANPIQPCVEPGCTEPRRPRSARCRVHFSRHVAKTARIRHDRLRESELPPCSKCGKGPRQIEYSVCRPCWLDAEREKRAEDRRMAAFHLEQLMAPPPKHAIRAYRAEWSALLTACLRPKVREDVRARFQRVLQRALARDVEGPERSTLYGLGYNEAALYVGAAVVDVE